MEADLAFRQVDLLDLWRGRITPRKLDVMIRGLPPDSATRIAMNGKEPLWSRTDYILADLIDSNNGVAWLVANQEVPVWKRGKYPDPYPRPGMESRKKEITLADLEAFRERTTKR
ncbi:tail assembly chaperone [Streptomyces phage SF1]|uniref:Tail assembly chaperone n=1 Tax=Streptomyces phage SF1 TaxID=1690817 RepID=A0A0K1Y579_9CAUD|nr:tail assembly chaperone [Streptomyces phage SF1]AKY02162.1 hypothetical protein SF1_130 [Streptomyces phage SF1]